MVFFWRNWGQIKKKDTLCSQTFKFLELLHEATIDGLKKFIKINMSPKKDKHLDLDNLEKEIENYIPPKNEEEAIRSAKTPVDKISIKIKFFFKHKEEEINEKKIKELAKQIYEKHKESQEKHEMFQFDYKHCPKSVLCFSSKSLNDNDKDKEYHEFLKYYKEWWTPEKKNIKVALAKFGAKIPDVSLRVSCWDLVTRISGTFRGNLSGYWVDAMKDNAKTSTDAQNELTKQIKTDNERITKELGDAIYILENMMRYFQYITIRKNSDK